jgi:hypothetical protein
MVFNPKLDFLVYYPYNRARNTLLYRSCQASGTSKNHILNLNLSNSIAFTAYYGPSYRFYRFYEPSYRFYGSSTA